jgi:hypothetical protein
MDNTSTFRLAKLITSYTENNTQGEYEVFCKRTLPLLSPRTTSKGIKLKRVNLSRPRTKYNSENRRNIEFRASNEQRNYSNLRGRNKLVNRSPEYNRKVRLTVPIKPINNIRNNMDRLLQSSDLLNSIIVISSHKYRMQNLKIKKVLTLLNPTKSFLKIA